VALGLRTKKKLNDETVKKYRTDITARRLLRASHSRRSNRCNLNIEHDSPSSEIIRKWQDTKRHHGAGSIAEVEEFDFASDAYSYDSSRLSSITFVPSGCSTSTGDNLKMKNRILRRETEGMFQHMDGQAQIPLLITTRKNEN